MLDINSDNSMQFVTRLEKNWRTGNDVSLSVLRGDLATPSAVGNKHFKLAENLTKLKSQGCTRLLSFGGAWSNHLHALSVQAKELDIQVVGIVRGDHFTDNQLLRSAGNHGMQIVPVSYSEYRQRNNRLWCEVLCLKHQCDTWLPEGGSNIEAVRGCKKILDLFESQQVLPDIITLAVGTGATLAGIASGMRPTQSVVGYPVIRDDQVPLNINRWLQNLGCTSSWRLTEPLKPHYAKVNTALIKFILDFYRDTGIALDPVYTGKALMQVLSGENIATLPKGCHLAFVHTGGLLGAFGYCDAFNQYRKTKPVVEYFSAIKKLTSPAR